MGERAAAQTTAGDHVRDPNNRPRKIAVDGSAASGKSTIGRRLAERLGYAFLDTGVMYRAVTHAALERGLSLRDGAAIGELAQTLAITVSLDLFVETLRGHFVQLSQVGIEDDLVTANKQDGFFDSFDRNE